MDATEKRKIGKTSLEITALGMGCASLGGLYGSVSQSLAIDTLRAAWDAGIRYFDVAPMYGLGRAEHVLGEFLREEIECKEPFVVSTKVGRLMANSRPGRVLPPELPKNPLDPGWSNGLPFCEVFDYSYDGIMRSFDDSQQRTGCQRLDILYVHDIGRATHADLHDHHWGALTGGGFRALSELRGAGLIGAIGLGVNEWEIIDEVLDEIDIDCALLAGRYTLLEQGALKLLDRAAAENVAIVVGGVFNSGVLAAGSSGNRKFNYGNVPAEIAERVDRLAAVCERFGVSLGAAALQFPFRHPAAKSVLIGAKHPSRVIQNVQWFGIEIADALWNELEARELIS
jgi:D-threo-aldose 1-dehydrogenase